MIQKLLTIYLPAAAVLSIVTVAGVFLYQTNDPELEEVEFITPTEVRIAESAEQKPEDTEVGIAENTEEAPEDTEGIAEHNEITEDAEKIAVELTTVVISGPGVSERCELELSEPETAHQVMQQAAEQCGFSYQWKKYASLGVFVDALAGVTTNKTKGKYWIYYVNGTKANVGVSSYTIVSGDELLWKYEQEY